MTEDAVHEFILDGLKEGKDRDDITQELLGAGVDKETIMRLLPIADNEHLTSLMTGEESLPKFKINRRIIGYFLMYLGVAVTLGTYYFSDNLYVIWYGPILAGVGLLVRSKRLNREDSRSRFSRSPYDVWRK